MLKNYAKGQKFNGIESLIVCARIFSTAISTKIVEAEAHIQVFRASY